MIEILFIPNTCQRKQEKERQVQVGEKRSELS